MADGALRDGFHLPTLAFAGAMAVLWVVAVATGDAASEPGSVVSFGLLVAFFVVTSIESVRDHDLYHLASAAVAAVVVALVVVTSEYVGPVGVVIVAVLAAKSAIELFNYRSDATVLRSDA